MDKVSSCTSFPEMPVLMLILTHVGEQKTGPVRRTVDINVTQFFR